MAVQGSPVLYSSSSSRFQYSNYSTETVTIVHAIDIREAIRYRDLLYDVLDWDSGVCVCVVHAQEVV